MIMKQASLTWLATFINRSQCNIGTVDMYLLVLESFIREIPMTGWIFDQEDTPRDFYNAKLQNLSDSSKSPLETLPTVLLEYRIKLYTLPEINECLWNMYVVPVVP